MNYEIRINQKVEKDFTKIPSKETLKILDKIETLSENPFPKGSKKIKSSIDNLYRLRQGNYRILYNVESEIKIVEIRRIGHRKDLYKSL